jgi:hypothetical protein
LRLVLTIQAQKSYKKSASKPIVGATSVRYASRKVLMGVARLCFSTSVCLLLVAFSNVRGASASAASSAVIPISGSVMIKGKTDTAIHGVAEVTPGDTIQTGSNSEASINLLPTVNVRVLENAQLLLRNFRPQHETPVRGGFAPTGSAIKSILTNNDSNVQLKQHDRATTTLALGRGATLISLRDTDLTMDFPEGTLTASDALFSVSVEPSGLARVTVAAGSVRVLSKNGQAVQVNPRSVVTLQKGANGTVIAGPENISNQPDATKDLLALRDINSGELEPIGEYKEAVDGKTALEPIGELLPTNSVDSDSVGAVGSGLSAPFDLAGPQTPQILAPPNPTNTGGPVNSRERQSP